MSGNKIEAKLLIAAEVAQAITKLRELKREVLATGRDLNKAGAGDAPGGSANRQQASQELAAARAAAAERQAARQAERLAERQAQAERLAADRAAAAARRAAARAEAEEAARQRKLQATAEAAQRQQQQEAQRRVRADANLQTNALRQLPAQVTDIVTGLSSGQAPMTVLIQQGGQLRDSFGGARAALKALLSLLTPARLLIGGVAAAVAAVAVNAAQGYRQQDRLNKALILTGEAGRASLGQIDGLARRIAASTNTSVGSVRETLEALVDVGVTSERSLSGAGRAATAYQRITGASAGEAAKLFEGQSSAILEWATKANKSYNFLTAAQVDHIRQLQAQGRTADAVRLVNDQLADSLEQRTLVSLTKLDRIWESIAKKVGDYIDKVRGLGRDQTPEERILEVQERLAEIQAVRENAVRRGATPSARISPEEASLRNELEGLVRRINARSTAAAQQLAAQKAEQDAALKQSKAYVDAEIALKTAGYQKALAARNAALDRERDAVEASRAQDYISAAEADVKLKDIERRRLLAQAQNLRDRIGLEGLRKPETPQDVENNRAAVLQLEAQLTEVQSRIKSAGGEIQNILAADGREQAELWAKAWAEAADRLRAVQNENATAANARLTDPVQRAREAGRLAAEELRRDIEQQARAITESVKNATDPVRAGQLEGALNQLRAEADTAIGERRRQAQFQSLQESLAQQIEAQQLLERDLASQVEQGALTTEDAEQRKLAARAGGVAQLERILRLLHAISATPAERTQVEQARQTVTQLQDLGTELEKTARASGLSELTAGLNDITTGAKTAGEALRDMVSGFARALLNVLNQRLAEQLINSLSGALKGGGGGGIGNLFSTASSWLASFFHTGGVIGSGAGRVARVAMPLALAGAQVLHNGGLVLKPNERAVVAEVGEEMLTADDPRHVKNFRGGGLTLNAEFIFEGGGSQQDQMADAEELLRRMRAVCEQYVAEQFRQGGRFSGVRRG